MGLKSECVCGVTQGWVSHKMLPLAGKRGMVWCGIVRHCYAIGVEVWYGRGVVWYMVKHGVSHKMLPLSQNYSPILSSRWAQIVLFHCGVV